MPRGSPPLPFEALLPFYRGAVLSTTALKGRVSKLPPEARKPYLDEVSHYQRMVTEILQAVEQTAALKQARQRPSAK